MRWACSQGSTARRRRRSKFAEIEASLAADHHRPRLSDLISKTTGRIRPIVWVGIGLATFQQLVGINVVFYYGAVLWQAVGFSESDALLINVLSGALSIGACLVTVALIDRIGRKPLLWIGSLGMGVTLAAMVVAFMSGSLDGGKLQLSGSMGTLALVAANAYVVFFNVSWGPVMWVMLGEMFPNQIRGSGLAVAGLSQWGSNFAVTITFPLLLAGSALPSPTACTQWPHSSRRASCSRFVHETRGARTGTDAGMSRSAAMVIAEHPTPRAQGRWSGAPSGANCSDQGRSRDLVRPTLAAERPNVCAPAMLDHMIDHRHCAAFLAPNVAHAGSRSPSRRHRRDRLVDRGQLRPTVVAAEVSSNPTTEDRAGHPGRGGGRPK